MRAGALSARLLTGLLGAVLITRPGPMAGMAGGTVSSSFASASLEAPLMAATALPGEIVPPVEQAPDVLWRTESERLQRAEPAAVIDPHTAEPGIQMQIPRPPIPLPDIRNPFDAFDRLNPKTLANDLLNAMLTAIGGALLNAIRSVVDWALGLGDSSLNIITHTPAQGTYQGPTVRSLWDFSRAVANAALALVVMWGGFGVMVKEHTRSPYHDLMELLPVSCSAPSAPA